MDVNWRITVEERTKHDASFMQLGPVNGFITGEKAREFFLKSQLPTNILGQIWALADLDKDGKLDKKEFSIACSLIKKVLTNGQSILPTSLPSSLLIDPTHPATLNQSTSGNFTNPTALANTPLFNATFPSATTQISPMNTGNQSGLSLASLNFNNNSTPISSFNPRLNPSQPSNLMSTMGNGMSMSMSSLGPSAQLNTPVNTNLMLVPYGSNFMNGLNTNNNLTVPTLFNNSLNYINPSGLFNRTSSSYRLPNPLAPIPSTSRIKYSQVFQSNDLSSTGYIAGQTAKTLLMQTGLPQAVLAQVWNLADYDKDGKLSLDEFINAMHLCDFAKAGNTLPAYLPIELQPQRSKTATLPMTGNVLDIFNSSAVVSPPEQKTSSQEALSKQQQQNTFEDKRRENFDRGNAVLEAKRQALREQEEREKREREEKERLEAEKRQRIKEEQERRRMAEIERQMERQRVLEAQREEERKKVFAQRELARQELLKQQRIEWERQKKQEMELQKVKLQEQLSILKAKDKNLEYDMQTLNEKIASYQHKITDTETNLSDLNKRLEITRQNYLIKQKEMDQKQRELQEYTQTLNKMRQEKGFLTERQNNLSMQAPYDQQHQPYIKELEQKQMTIQQLRDEMEKMELQISTARTQINSVKTELEASKTNEMSFYQENSRLQSQIDLRRPQTNSLKNNSSFSQSMELTNVTGGGFKPSLSINNIRSATPKENYDAFKDEIFKIQQNVNKTNTTSPVYVQDQFSSNLDPFSVQLSQYNQSQSQQQITSPQQDQNQGNFSANWSDAFNTSNDRQFDPFGADPFTQLSNQPAANGFDNVWQSHKTSNSFQSSFMNQDLAASTNFSDNGFGDTDNWASTALNKNLNTSSSTNPTATASKNSNVPGFSSQSESNSDNWANFDEPSVKDQINMFNKLPIMTAPAATAPISNLSNQPNTQPILLNSVKFSAQYAFDASREDELSIQIGDIINVDLSVKTDEGWLYGECQGRIGVFPAAFTVKLSDLQSQPSSTANTPISPRASQFPTSESFRSNKSFPVSSSFPNQAAINSNINNNQLSNIKNYYFAIYPYQSTEPGDLVFREFEIINVIDRNEDWLTGQIVGTGAGPSNPLRAGIFPANFVIKFNFPIEYIGKYTIGMATESYSAQNGGELSLNPAESQLIAIKKISPDGKWSYGESYDMSNVMKKGWFPVQSAMSLIDAGVTPLYVPNAQEKSSPNSSSSNPATPTVSGNKSLIPSPSNTSISLTPPPPQAATSPLTTPIKSQPTPTDTTISQVQASTTITSSTSQNEIHSAEPSQNQSANTAQIASSNLQSNSETNIIPQNTDLPSLSTQITSTDSAYALNSEGGDTFTPVFSSSKTNSNENLSFSTNTQILTQPEESSKIEKSPEQALSNYNLRLKLSLNLTEKSKAEEVLERALANSHSLFQLCRDLNQESSFESVEPLDELRIEENEDEEPVSSTPKSSSKQKDLTASKQTPASATTTTSAKPSIKATNSKPIEDLGKPVEEPNKLKNQPTLPSGIIDQVVALYDFASTTPETIGFPKDAVINIIEKSGDWWLGEYNGKMGLLPYNYVQSIVKTGDEVVIISDLLAQDKTYLAKIRAEFRSNRKNSSQIITNNHGNNTYRNSLQTDEELGQTELDSSFEEDEDFNDESLSAEKMETSSRTSSTLYYNIEFGAGLGNNVNNGRAKKLMPKEELRLNVLNEIIETEQKYIKDLKFILECYKAPLKANRLLSRTELDIMFGNLEDIIPINTKFLNSLVLRANDAKQSGEFPKFGDIFIEHLPRMQLYSKFVAGKRYGEELIQEKMKTSPEFAQYLQNNLNGDAGDFLLKKLLLLPMQRLTQYQLLVERLLKSLTSTDEEHHNMQKASQLIVELIKSINNEVGRAEELERLEWLDEHVNIKEGSGFRFVSLTNSMGPRCIIYYGPLVKENEFNKGKDLYGFLFNDSFLLIEASESLHAEIFKAKKLSPLNVYKQPMLLDCLSSVHARMGGQSGSQECSFQVVLNGKEVSFRTTNPTLKNEWIKQILRAIEAYRQRKNLIKNSIVTSFGNQKDPVGRFLLVIMEAQDLFPSDTEHLKAFCEAEMGGKKFNSQTIDSLNPKWNLSVQFSVYDVNKDVLSVSVFDSRQFKPNVFLGKVEIRMANVLRDQLKQNQENGPVPITRCFRMNNAQSGKLLLKMSLSIFN